MQFWILPVAGVLRSCLKMFLVPGFGTTSRARPQLASKKDATAGSFCTRLFSPISSFSIYLPCLYLSCLYLPCLYLPCFYISLLFISPTNPGPLTLLYSQFPSTHNRPHHLTKHAASANQGSRGISPPKWIHQYPGIPAQLSRYLWLIWVSQVQIIRLSCSPWRLWDYHHTHSSQQLRFVQGDKNWSIWF